MTRLLADLFSNDDDLAIDATFANGDAHDDG
jgi:hypothetical protein